MSPRSTQKMPKCTQCGAPVGILDTFPGNICLKCHAKRFDEQNTLETLTGKNIAASFIKSINI